MTARELALIGMNKTRVKPSIWLNLTHVIRPINGVTS
uniref:Uncharacterized protein n=1 Tax=Anguilla anguilla TaxID=7936 RepID=A0A0E9S1R1_ANGAN